MASPDYCCISFQPLWHTSTSPKGDYQHSVEKDGQMVGKDETAKSRCTKGSPMKLPVHNNLKYA
jgi:hypothetical protein